MSVRPLLADKDRSPDGCYVVYWVSSSNRLIQEHQWWRRTKLGQNDARMRQFDSYGAAVKFHSKLVKLRDEGDTYAGRTVLHVSPPVPATPMPKPEPVPDGMIRWPDGSVTWDPELE